MISLQEITQFVIDNAEKSRGSIEFIQSRIKKHIAFGTYTIGDDEKGITHVCIWNIEGVTAQAIDCIVRKDLRNRGMIKKIVIMGLIKFPYVRNISWERVFKYPRRKFRFYTVKQLLGE